MYENITYEDIVNRMIDEVKKNDSNIDTREGSVIYNALAPAAVELKNMYINLDVILNETFADTASREYLIKRVAERGILPESATRAIVKGVFDVEIPIGSRFSSNDLIYVVDEKIEEKSYKLSCETFGFVGNDYGEILIPISYIDNLKSARITEILIPGEDEEDTEKLRQRYFDSLDSQAFGGNVADYREKVAEIHGVGGVKVYPVWNGGGTVKLIIIDSSYNCPSNILINSVQNIIDPKANQGEGKGIAPIGHVVTVEGVNPISVNITTSIVYEEGWKWEDVEKNVNKVIDDYFKNLSESWDNENKLIVRISHIETRILDVKGIVDISDTKLNEVAQNLVLDEVSIPVRGSINV